MIVHEIKLKNKIFNVRFFNILFTLKRNPIFEELPKYFMKYLVTA